MADQKNSAESEVGEAGSNSDAPKRKGLVHVYTGDGKGKTTAALGLALRSIGHGYNVHIIQFLKGGHYTGELVAAEIIFEKSGQLKISQFGKGCFKTEKQMRLVMNGKGVCPKNFNVRVEGCGECRECFLSDAEEIEQTKEAINLAKEVLQSDDVDVVVLDEITHVVNKKIVSVQEFLEMIEMKRPHIELVLTGRNAPKELIEKADLVTEMKEVKHPFQKGIEGRKGIEY